MRSMNEKTITIRLRDLMYSPDGWGHEEGREVGAKFLAAVEAHPGIRVFRVSLEGVARTDASFPRESVIEIARRYRGDKGFCLYDVSNVDLLDNWSSAAERKRQPVCVWNGGSHTFIGLAPSKGNAAILNYALSREAARATDAAQELDMKLTNASTKLKQLWEQGFLLRREEIADTGGVEFTYYRIK